MGVMSAFHPLTGASERGLLSCIADIGVSNDKDEMRSILLALMVALLSCTTPYFGPATAFAKVEARSSLEDQQRYVSIVRKLDRDPLDVSLHDDRAWAMEWLVNAPDLTVTACLDPLGDVAKSHYAYSDEIVAQYMFGMGAFVLQNPSKANDLDAQQLAGVESSLVAYQSIKTARPDQLSPALENLLGMQVRGDLPAFVKAAFLQCQAKNGT